MCTECLCDAARVCQPSCQRVPHRSHHASLSSGVLRAKQVSVSLERVCPLRVADPNCLQNVHVCEENTVLPRVWERSTDRISRVLTIRSIDLHLRNLHNLDDRHRRFQEGRKVGDRRCGCHMRTERRVQPWLADRSGEEKLANTRNENILCRFCPSLHI